MAALPGVTVFPSAANFILLRITRPGLTGTQVFERLSERKVLVKNVGRMHALLDNCLRVTVSTPAENAQFLAALESSLNS
jgi:histidinol-phosphate aminotransferase